MTEPANKLVNILENEILHPRTAFMREVYREIEIGGNNIAELNYAEDEVEDESRAELRYAIHKYRLCEAAFIKLQIAQNPNILKLRRELALSPLPQSESNDPSSDDGESPVINDESMFDDSIIFGNGEPLFHTNESPSGSVLLEFESPLLIKSLYEFENGTSQFDNGVPQSDNGAPQFNSVVPQSDNGAPQFNSDTPKPEEMEEASGYDADSDSEPTNTEQELAKYLKRGLERRKRWRARKYAHAKTKLRLKYLVNRLKRRVPQLINARMLLAQAEMMLLKRTNNGAERLQQLRELFKIRDVRASLGAIRTCTELIKRAGSENELNFRESGYNTGDSDYH